jgi:hypothetical protein
VLTHVYVTCRKPSVRQQFQLDFLVLLGFGFTGLILSGTGIQGEEEKLKKGKAVPVTGRGGPQGCETRGSHIF